VTALFTFNPKSGPGPNTASLSKELPSTPENRTRSEMGVGPPTSKKVLAFTLACLSPYTQLQQYVVDSAIFYPTMLYPFSTADHVCKIEKERMRASVQLLL